VAGPPASLNPRAQRLLAKVRASARDRPGVYRFLGPRGEILYVGKSVRLRSRLLSWFREPEGTKGGELLRVVSDVDWDATPTEFEAVLREFRLIRAARPRYNLHHRRDRRFAWVRVTKGPAPRLVATRTPRPDGSRYHGPFPGHRHLPKLLADLARISGLRDCPASTPMQYADQLDFLPVAHSPLCARGETGSCPAPCAGGCTEEEYRVRVRKVEDFLEGRSDHLPEDVDPHRPPDAPLRDIEAALLKLRDDLVEFDRHIRKLDFVYRPPESPEGERTPRRHLVLSGLVKMTFDMPEPGSGAARELADRLTILLARPPVPPTGFPPPSGKSSSW
jgi:excinuclease ABC subunit C